MSEFITIDGCKRITELHALNKLTGKEEVLIDNGENTYKVTVDSLLGYIASQINAGNYPTSITESTNIIVIPEDDTIPFTERDEDSFYLNVNSTTLPGVVASLNNRVRVSPNMGLKVVDK